MSDKPSFKCILAHCDVCGQRRSFPVSSDAGFHISSDDSAFQDRAVVDADIWLREHYSSEHPNTSWAGSTSMLMLSQTEIDLTDVHSGMQTIIPIPNHERGRLHIDKLTGMPCCDHCGVEMEAQYGSFRCPGCQLTISEETYYENLHKYIEEHGLPELRYPV